MAALNLAVFVPVNGIIFMVASIKERKYRDARRKDDPSFECPAKSYEDLTSPSKT